MMELNNKEKKIKEVLKNVNYDIDTDFLWKEVSQELDKDNKKRRLFWIFPISGFAALIFLVSNFVNFGPTNLVESPVHLSEKQSTTKGIEKPSSLSSAQTDLQGAETKHEFKNAIDSGAKEKHENSVNNSTSDVAGNVEIESNLDLVIVDSNVSTTETKLSSTRNVASTQNKPTQNLSSNSTISIDIRSSDAIANQTTDENKVTLIDGDPLVELLSNSINRMNTKPSVINSLSAPVLQLNAISRIPFSLLMGELMTSSNLPVFAKTEIELNEPSKRFYLGVGGGLIKDISSNTSGGFEFPSSTYEKETALWASNFQVLFGMELKRSFRIFGGLDYSHLVTRFINDETDSFNGTVQSSIEVIDETNAYTSVEGNLSTMTLVDNDIIWHKHIQSVNLQVGLSKDLLPRRKLMIAPEFSLLRNLISNHKGYYFEDQESTLKKFINGEENPYRKNLGLMSQLGLSLGYSINAFEFSMQGSWRRPFSEITNETNFYQIRNSQLSFQARVNYLLNWENN